MNERDRITTYKGSVKCDSSLGKGWYRFAGDAGTQMPTKCVPKLQCGTHAPGWLSGAHPTVGEGAVQRKVCFHWSSGCCQWSSNILVRNCGGFFVYELDRPPACNLRYCGEKTQGRNSMEHGLFFLHAKKLSSNFYFEALTSRVRVEKFHKRLKTIPQLDKQRNIFV